jgi:dipeptide/tripeptide permease
MVVAGHVECKRRNSALSNRGKSPMTVLWLAPQLVLMGIAEAFNTVGQIEFYNKQFPEHMQTLAGSLSFLTVAGATYLSTVLVNIIRNCQTWPHKLVNKTILTGANLTIITILFSSREYPTFSTSSYAPTIISTRQCRPRLKSLQRSISTHVPRK